MIYAINLAPYVAVCLHCGEIGPDGALFCTKCGYTLPQADLAPSPISPASAGAVAPARAAPSTSAAPPPAPYGALPPPTAYAVPTTVIPGAVGPIPAPPSGKYCVRCRTIIARSAVYCPVCQQPQP